MQIMEQLKTNIINKVYLCLLALLKSKLFQLLSKYTLPKTHNLRIDVLIKKGGYKCEHVQQVRAGKIETSRFVSPNFGKGNIHALENLESQILYN